MKWANNNENEYKQTLKLEFKWSVDKTKKIVEGDRALFIRQSSNPKGILVFGTVLTKPYEADHWYNKDKIALYVDLDWKYFSSEFIISIEELEKPILNQVP